MRFHTTAAICLLTTKAVRQQRQTVLTMVNVAQKNEENAKRAEDLNEKVSELEDKLYDA